MAGQRVQRAAWRAANRIHVGIYELSKGRLGGRMMGGELLLLSTKGRRSGRVWTNPLLFVREGDAFVVIASNGGQDRHPAWYLNLQADPGARIQVGSRRIAVRARTATAEERAPLWRRIVAAYPGYRKYETKRTLEIPLVFLVPTGTSAAS
jgi:deazaflavin-dependent oxidoreductase (nitroreductase family)